MGDDDRGGTLGHAYIFVRGNDPADWKEQAILSASNGAVLDQFGWSVSLSDDGTVLAVGAHQESNLETGVHTDSPAAGSDNNAALYSGAVYLFGKEEGQDNWPLQAYIKASNTGVKDNFGYSVSLNQDGTVLAVGAYGEASSAKGASADKPPTDDNAAPDSGAVYLFGREGQTWTQNAYIKANNTGTGDKFGGSVSLSDDGQRLVVGAVVGAFGEDSNAAGLNGNDADDTAAESGAAYSYVYRDGSWQFESYLKASNTGADDRFGSALSLSGDGQTLAVGAFKEGSNGQGVGGLDGDDLPENYDPQANDSMSRSGAVYLY